MQSNKLAFNQGRPKAYPATQNASLKSSGGGTKNKGRGRGGGRERKEGREGEGEVASSLLGGWTPLLLIRELSALLLFRLPAASFCIDASHD